MAFIETAWRRYTKHSRNKAQEIQGAIVPLAETYRSSGPFKGAVLAGVFTVGALVQLRSLGFTVLYFPYDTIVEVFRRFAIDVAFDEDTSEAELHKKIESFDRLSKRKHARLSEELLRANVAELREFVTSLESATTRQIKRIVILPLHGESYEVSNIDDAVKFVEGYEGKEPPPIVRWEIQIRYNNDNVITGDFNDKPSAIDFLLTFRPLSGGAQ